MNSLEVGDKEALKGEDDEDVEERSIEELSWSSEPEEEEGEEEESEEIPEDAEIQEKAKIMAKKEMKKMKSAFDEFQASKESGENLYNRTKKWFGFY
jgi:hypothetical protein